MLEDVLAFAALPLAAAVLFTGIHTWFGLQVLRRNVVFADLALAQVSALGATVAVVAGHAMPSAAGYAYTLLFAAAGAAQTNAATPAATNRSTLPTRGKVPQKISGHQGSGRQPGQRIEKSIAARFSRPPY